MKRWVPAMVLGGFVLIICFCIYRPLANEPKYDGKPVSYWFKEYCLSGQHVRYNPARQKEALAGLNGLGTNAVPYLVQQSFNFHQDSAARSNFCRFMQSLPDSWSTPRPVSSRVRVEEAPFAIKSIQPPASVLLPLIKKELEVTNGKKYLQALFLAGTAGDGGEEFVPYLVAALSNTNIHARRLALQSLQWLGPHATAATPALLKVVEENRGVDTNYLGRAAIGVLGKIGSSNALAAIPAIKEKFEQEKIWSMQCLLAGILFRIDPNQTQALDFLMEGVANHQPARERWGAAHELGEIGPAARVAMPVLLEALDGTNELLISEAPRALKKLGVANDVFLPLLKKRLSSRNEAIAANAAARVLEMDPADHDAHLVLIDFIQKGSTWRQYAIETLDLAGPAAAEALPTLREVATREGSSRVGEAARAAIRRIALKPKSKE